MVSFALADGIFRPMHELGGLCCYCIYFLLLLPSAAPIVSHAGEHDISSMLLRVFILYPADWPNRRLLRRRRRRAGRRRGLESVTLGDPGEPVALPGGVAGRLRTAVELAGCIKGLLV